MPGGVQEFDGTDEGLEFLRPPAKSLERVSALTDSSLPRADLEKAADEQTAPVITKIEKKSLLLMENLYV